MDLPNDDEQIMDSDHEIPPEFTEMSNEFVTLANSLGEKWPRTRVSATLMYAAARFNAYNWLSGQTDPDQTESEATAYYTQQYREMFLKNAKELRASMDKGDDFESK